MKRMIPMKRIETSQYASTNDGKVTTQMEGSPLENEF